MAGDEVSGGVRIDAEPAQTFILFVQFAFSHALMISDFPFAVSVPRSLDPPPRIVPFALP
jgi:hypothetical protein